MSKSLLGIMVLFHTLRHCPLRQKGLIFYFKIHISTSDEAPGLAELPKCQNFAPDFETLGFRCNHVVLERLGAKSLTKRAKDGKKGQNFQCFWTLAAFKPRGRT